MQQWIYDLKKSRDRELFARFYASLTIETRIARTRLSVKESNRYPFNSASVCFDVESRELYICLMARIFSRPPRRCFRRFSSLRARKCRSFGRAARSKIQIGCTTIPRVRMIASRVLRAAAAQKGEARPRMEIARPFFCNSVGYIHCIVRFHCLFRANVRTRCRTFSFLGAGRVIAVTDVKAGGSFLIANSRLIARQGLLALPGTREIAEFAVDV